MNKSIFRVRARRDVADTCVWTAAMIVIANEMKQSIAGCRKMNNLINYRSLL